jgi:hypothetical protein
MLAGRTVDPNMFIAGQHEVFSTDTVNADSGK